MEQSENEKTGQYKVLRYVLDIFILDRQKKTFSKWLISNIVNVISFSE